MARRGLDIVRAPDPKAFEAVSNAPVVVTPDETPNYKKKSGIDVGEAGSVAELLALSKKVDESANNYALNWYRGVGNADWPLVPRLLGQFDLMSERFLFSGFKNGAHMRHERCPTQDDHAGWLSLMQHPGSIPAFWIGQARCSSPPIL